VWAKTKSLSSKIRTISPFGEVFAKRLNRSARPIFPVLVRGVVLDVLGLVDDFYGLRVTGFDPFEELPEFLFVGGHRD
jgi:hypothetical protein